MAKSEKKIQARILRRKGESIKEIGRKIGVSKSTVSVWCRDIELTLTQIDKLHESMVKGSYAGRMKGARIQRAQKEEKIRYYLNEGLKDIGKLTDRELFMVGLGLYWGEGNKKNGGVRFCNSDPAIIKLILEWLVRILGVDKKAFCAYTNINKIHKERTGIVKKFWIDLTGISDEQFRKVVLINSKNKKVYENLDDHFGTLDLRILKSTYLLYQIKGWLKALAMAG